MKRKLCAWLLAISVASTSVPMTALAAGTTEQQASGETTMDTKQETELPTKESKSEKNLPDDTSPADSTEEKEEEKNTEQQTKYASEDVENTEEKDIPKDEEEDTKENETAEPAEDEKTEEMDFEERTGSLEQPTIIEISEDALVENTGETDGQSKERSVYGSAAYKSAWDSYSSNYIYNQLNAAEQRFWDVLDNACYYYLTQNVDAVKVQLSDGSLEAVPAKNLWADFSYVGKERAKDLLVMFSYSNPQYYFLDSSTWLISGNYLIPDFYMNFQTGSARTAATSAVQSQVNEWMPQIKAGTSETEKAKIAHDLIVTKVKYDNGYYNGNFANPFHQSAYSVFAKANNICTGTAGYTVCAGYAKAFTMLMNGAGVDAMSVTSYNHAWNMVNINDSWYHLDCTWDDLDENESYGNMSMMYTFFCRSYSELLSESGGQQESHKMEDMYTGVTPSSTLDSKSYWNTVGTCHTPTARTANPTMTQKTVSGGVQVTLTCTSPNAEIYYTINGTNPSSNYTRSYRYKGAFNIAGGTTVKAVAVCNTLWDSTVSSIVSNKVPVSYKVTFHSNGGSSVAAQTVVSNGTAKKPGNPTRSGYSFVGWYTDSGCTKAYNFSTKVTKNMTLYAKWLKKYTVKFNANSGSVKTKSKTVVYSKKYGTLPTPTRTKYTFSGWYTKKSGGTKITANSAVKITKNTTLYAHWKKVSVSKTSISKLQNLSGKKLKVTAKKVSGVKGYQIRYSTKSNLKSAKSVTSKTNAITAKKLTKGKKYYVQVRAYKVDSAGKKVWGKWSKTKTIKIKK